MSGVQTVLLVSFLLPGALCDQFDVSLPKHIEVLCGSCVTIPCSFQVPHQYKSDLSSECRALWKDAINDQPVTFSRQTTGDLTQYNCTTTLHEVQHTGTYFFRLECDNALKYNFKETRVNIQVNEAPPTPTLTPPTLNVREGESVSVQCSAPVPCPSLPPTLTWSPDLGDIQETLQETQDKTYVKVSTLNFTASHIHHEKNITCTAVYSREDGTNVSSVSQLISNVTYGPRNTRVTASPCCPVSEHSDVTLKCRSDANPAVKHYHWYKADGGTHTLIGNRAVLKIKASKDTTLIFCEAQNDHGTHNSTVTQLDVQFSPQILTSSNCTGDTAQIRCLCETEGNPFPMIQWDLSGISTIHSVSSEPLSDKALKSVITVKEPQWRDPVTLVCHSRNSLGSDRQSFNVPAFKQETTVQQQGDVMILVFIALRVVSLLAFPCALLFMKRSLNGHQNHHQPTAMVMEQLPASNEVDTASSENIYENTSNLRL